MIPKYILITIPHTWNNGTVNRIEAIRSIRTLGNLSLKVAKEITDQPGVHKLEVKISEFDHLVTPETVRAAFYAEIHRLGENVRIINDERLEPLVKRLHRIAATAVLLGETEFAADLLPLLKKYGVDKDL